MKKCIIDGEEMEYNEETQRPVQCGGCPKLLRIVNLHDGEPFFEECEECERRYRG